MFPNIARHLSPRIFPMVGLASMEAATVLFYAIREGSGARKYMG